MRKGLEGKLRFLCIFLDLLIYSFIQKGAGGVRIWHGREINKVAAVRNADDTS